MLSTRNALRTLCLVLSLLVAFALPTVAMAADGDPLPPQDSSQGGDGDGGTELEPIEIEPEGQAPSSSPEAVTFRFGAWFEQLVAELTFGRLLPSS